MREGRYDGLLADLARKLAALEKKYDAQFKIVFDAIRELMTPPTKPRRLMGWAAVDVDDNVD